MEIFTDPNLQEETMRELYDASMKGSVSTLNTLIKRDPLILKKISLYPFTDTPLHIASLLGHLEFCEILIYTNPSLANEVNSEGRCALHLASAKGHTEIVKLLLKTNSGICLVRDKDEKLPLHFAAMRGHVEVIKELVIAKPDCVREITENDDGSVLHLCVTYNHLEALKLLVESVKGDYQFLSARDREGNTVLHLALRLRKIKMIQYLVSLSEMSTAIYTMNKAGLTAEDMLKWCPTDFIKLTIEQISSQEFTNEVVPQEPDSSPSNSPPQPSIPSSHPSPSNEPQQPSHPLSPSMGGPSVWDPPQSPSNDPQQASQPQSPSNANHGQAPHPSPPRNGPLHQPPNSSNITNNEQQESSRWNTIENFCRTYLLNQGNWIDKKQLMVVATVIATMTFQSALSPPGGVWQADSTDGGYACPDYGFCEAGTAVVGYVWAPDFLKFVFLNSASFFASLCVVLIIISGFPLDTKVMIWILSILMIVAASCMLLTYMWALGLVCPNHIYYRIHDLGYIMVGTWAVLLLLVTLIQMTRIVFWLRSRRRRRSLANAPPVREVQMAPAA